MSKRKRKSRLRQSSAALLRNGLAAFNQGEYAQAIHDWERVANQTPSKKPTEALAEAYFRRGMALANAPTSDYEAALEHLRKARALRPDEVRYIYHTALVMQRQGELEAAMELYQKVLDDADFAQRAAYPLALALLHQGQEVRSHPVWALLSDEARGMLKYADAFQRRPYAVGEDAPSLWQGLAALDQGDYEIAREMLKQVLETDAMAYTRGVAQYYLGVLAAQNDDLEAARRAWDAAAAEGFRRPYLVDNLGEVYHRLAEARLAEDDVEGALVAAEEALRHKSEDNRLIDLRGQIYQHEGYQAALAGDWPTAIQQWQQAYDLQGGSFRICYNLALAHEQVEDFISAGELWREALRRRPRREDHPDAVTDEQVGQIWARAAEAYTKAGEFDEAIHVYKLAVKWNPDDLETRMRLVNGLIDNGQLVAAQNELERILNKNEEYVPALLQMAEVLAQSEYWWQTSGATQYWSRVLEIEPDNAPARQGLIDYYLDQGDRWIQWGRYEDALESYKAALAVQPENGLTWAILGGCYLWMGDEGQAHKKFEQALKYGVRDLDTYSYLIHMWLSQQKEEQAWRVLEIAESQISSIPFTFYLSQAHYGMEGDFPVEVIKRWLDKTVDVAQPQDHVFVMIGELLLRFQVFDLAREYLNQAIDAEQSLGQVYLLLGVVEQSVNNKAEARRYWSKAESIARKTGDQALEEQIIMTRRIFSMPPDMASMLMNMAQSGVMPEFFEDDFEGEGEAFYDDDDLFDFFGL